jgi:hypothetical protein
LIATGGRSLSPRPQRVGHNRIRNFGVSGDRGSPHVNLDEIIIRPRD